MVWVQVCHYQLLFLYNYTQLFVILLVTMVCVWPQTLVSVPRDMLVTPVQLQVCQFNFPAVCLRFMSYFFIAVFTECEENVCEGGGTCQMLAGSFICTCPPRLTGTRCDLCKEKNNFMSYSKFTAFLWV